MAVGESAKAVKAGLVLWLRESWANSTLEQVLEESALHPTAALGLPMLPSGLGLGSAPATGEASRRNASKSKLDIRRIQGLKEGPNAKVIKRFVGIGQANW